MMKMQVKNAAEQMFQMQQTGHQLLEISQVSEIPHVQSDLDPSEIMSQEQQMQIPMGESVVLEKFKNKMAAIISASTLQFSAVPGAMVPIQITVLNKAAQSWPRKPFLCVDKTSQTMLVGETLGPSQQTQINFDFQVPRDAERIFVC
jgi:hypothetical protein